jgi:flagellar hook-associated protein 2
MKNEFLILSVHFQGRKEGIFMARIASVYDYYVHTYASREVSRYDSHKKSDLRKVYNDMVKTNKESPLYKILNVVDAAKYAIDIKEQARTIQNVVDSLSDESGGFSSAFQKKVAESSDSETVSATYVGDGKEAEPLESFEIQVNRLASPQKNTGNFMNDNDHSFIPGSYSFDMNTTRAAYEFQYNVDPGETNRNVLDKLCRLVNSADIGIIGEVIQNEEGQSALSLTSKQTGLSEDEDYLFSIKPSVNADSIRAMNQLGIHQVSEPAHSSSFLLNGVERSSLSNRFTINNTFELTLNKPNAEGASTRIGFKTNSDAIADNIQTLVDAYNGMLTTSKNYPVTSQAQGRRLFSELSGITRRQQTGLNSIGLKTDEDGYLKIDRDILSDAVTPERTEATFDTLNHLKNAIRGKADNASLNPMQYVNKLVVAYKNPGHNFPTPYITSIYSGMLLDNRV